MVKGRRLPCGRIVALRTGVAELIGRVIRAIRNVEIVLMTGIAVRGGSHEAMIDMALHTAHGGMRACQGITNKLVIECRGLPSGGRMTGCAIVIVVVRCVIGIRDIGIIGQVAAITICGQSAVISSVRMTLPTSDGGMSAG
jgi:hypothetical protein